MHRPDRKGASGSSERADSVCTSIAMAAEDVLADPRFAYTAKHIKVLRPPVRTQKQMDIILLYLGYHLTKESAYDMAFSILEPDPGFTVSPSGQVQIDWDVAPPTVYCTELPWRALVHAGIRSRTTTVNPLLTRIMHFIPLIPEEMLKAWRGPQVPPDVFHAEFTTDWDGQVTSGAPELIYANEPPPPPLEVIRSLPDSVFKRLYLSVFVTLGWCR